MHPEICDIVDTFVYNGILRSDRVSATRYATSQLPYPGHLVLVDMSSVNARAQIDRSSMSHYCKDSAPSLPAWLSLMHVFTDFRLEL